MKHAYLLLLTPLILHAEIDYTRYQDQAQQWLQKHLVDDTNNFVIPHCDVQLIANFLRAAHDRSKKTDDAQAIGLEALVCAWNGFQNIARTRLNPSCDLPHQIDYDQQQQLFSDFIHEQITHRKAGLTYAHAVKALLEESKCSTTLATTALENLRTQSRVIVMNAFLSVKQQLELFHDCAHEFLKTADDKEDRGIKEMILSFLPVGFAFSSFLRLESCYITASDKGWYALEQIQYMMAQIYRAIEQERASFYGAHYYALLKLMQKNKCDKKYMTVAFNERGLIQARQRRDILPAVL